MAQPATKGILGMRRLIAIAVPITSAISVAMICYKSAESDQIQNYDHLPLLQP